MAADHACGKLPQQFWAEQSRWNHAYTDIKQVLNWVQVVKSNWSVGDVVRKTSHGIYVNPKSEHLDHRGVHTLTSSVIADMQVDKSFQVNLSK